MIYSDFGDSADKVDKSSLSQVEITCPISPNPDPAKICDSFEVGIIGNLDYEVYDIAIMITGVPDKILVEEDLARLSFRMSHLDDDFLTWFAGVRLFCIIVTVCTVLLYFITSCSRSGINVDAYSQLNLNQCCIVVLLFLCILYNEPLFEFRKYNPSTELAIIGEVPAAAFFTALLTYWLMSIAYVRARERNLQKRLSD